MGDLGREFRLFSPSVELPPIFPHLTKKMDEEKGVCKKNPPPPLPEFPVTSKKEKKTRFSPRESESRNTKVVLVVVDTLVRGIDIFFSPMQEGRVKRLPHTMAKYTSSCYFKFKLAFNFLKYF